MFPPFSRDICPAMSRADTSIGPLGGATKTAIHRRLLNITTSRLAEAYRSVVTGRHPGSAIWLWLGILSTYRTSLASPTSLSLYTCLLFIINND